MSSSLTDTPNPLPSPGTARASFALLGLVFLTFWTVTSHGFLGWDDVRQILENPDFGPATLDGLWWNFSNTRMTLYMPVTYTLWWTLAVLTGEGREGLNPFYFHLLNVALHAGTVLVVFAILRRLTHGSTRGAFVGAALFAVHPVMAEPVAWASAMYTVLSGLLSCLAIAAHLRALERPAAPHRGWYVAATVFYIVALLSKASSVVVPFMLLSLHLVLLHTPARVVFKSLLPWIVLAVPTLLVARHFEPASHVADVPALTRPSVAVDAYAFYIGKVLLPVNLMTDYGRTPTWVVQSGAIHRAWAVVVMIVVLAAVSRSRLVISSLVMSAVALLPFVGLARSNFQTYSTVADRYLYLAMLGVALLSAGAVERALRISRVRKWLIPACLLVIVVLAFVTHQQARTWRDDYTLFAHNLELNPSSMMSKRVLAANWDHRPGRPFLTQDDLALQLEVGDDYAKAQGLERAVVHYEYATRADPNSAIAWLKLAGALSATGMPDRARQASERAAELDASDKGSGR